MNVLAVSLQAYGKESSCRLLLLAFPLTLFYLLSLPMLVVGDDFCSKSITCSSGSDNVNDRPQFCNFDYGEDEGGFCEPCTANPEACFYLGLPDAGGQNCAEVCSVPMDCSGEKPCDDEYGEYFCNFDYGDDEGGFCEYCGGLFSADDCDDLGLPDRGAESCRSSCKVFGTARTLCSADEPCPQGSYCNHEFDDMGYCEECGHLHACSDLEQPLAIANCADSCSVEYYDVNVAETTVSGKQYDTLAMIGSPAITATGILVDCRSNIDERDDDEVDEGRGVGEVCAQDVNATGNICLIDRDGTPNYFWEKVQSCERVGGAAAIIYNGEPGLYTGTLIQMETGIPSVSISMEDGLDLLKTSIGSMATVSVEYGGQKFWTHCSAAFSSMTCPGQTFCFYWYDDHGYCEDPEDGFCSTSHPCPASSFCNFDYGDQGKCEECEGYDDVCYFSGLPLPGARECAEVCESSISTPECKFCPADLSLDSLGTARDADDVCDFCPSGLKDEVSDREMRMFGLNVDCFLVDEFFTNYEISKSDENCQLAQMMNYVCECEGTGYAGANTKTKQIILAWLPRVMAILSFMGSVYIIVDVAYINKRKRKKVFGQLMLGLSIFDLFGSVAYALTTLPLPQEDYIYGSHGNMATCKAQGFFIQVGTISAYINVSLAVYYFCTINLSWSEIKLKKIRHWFFICPMIVGFSLAFAGIPFYDNMILWCNNSADYWPDIPVAVAIFLVTIIMFKVCTHVRRQENVSKRWRQGGGTPQNSLSTKVFWQAFWYLMAFYMTWPPYLALQYLWASGKAYSNYGFIVYAGTVVPLQGLWNFFVYVRRRISVKDYVPSWASSIYSKISSATLSSSRFSGRSSQPPTTQSGESSTNPGTAVSTGVSVSKQNSQDGFVEND